MHGRGARAKEWKRDGWKEKEERTHLHRGGRGREGEEVEEGQRTYKRVRIGAFLSAGPLCRLSCRGFFWAVIPVRSTKPRIALQILPIMWHRPQFMYQCRDLPSGVVRTEFTKPKLIIPFTVRNKCRLHIYSTGEPSWTKTLRQRGPSARLPKLTFQCWPFKKKGKERVHDEGSYHMALVRQ